MPLKISQAWPVAALVLCCCKFAEPAATGVLGTSSGESDDGSSSTGTGPDASSGDPDAPTGEGTSTSSAPETDESSTTASESESTGDGVHDWALDFDGDDYAASSASPDISLPQAFTIELWLQVGEIPYHGILMDTRPVGIDEGWVLFVGPPSNALANQLVIGWFADDGSTPGLEGPQVTGLQPGWHHFAVTRRADGISKMFVDGVETVSGLTELPPAPQDETLAVGRYKRGGPESGLWWRGAPLDDLRISSVARYDAPFVPTRPEADADTLLLWHFDEGEGDVASDDVAELALDLEGPTWVAGAGD